MKALSIKQPWAWLIVNGYKDVENRDWPTKIRGQVLIHAGKAFDKAGYEWVKQNFPDIPMPAPDAFDAGGVVGQASITDCVAKSDSRWFFGQYGFVLADGKPLPFRAYRGQLGFFEVADDSV